MKLKNLFLVVAGSSSGLNSYSQTQAYMFKELEPSDHCIYGSCYTRLIVVPDNQHFQTVSLHLCLFCQATYCSIQISPTELVSCFSFPDS